MGADEAFLAVRQRTDERPPTNMSGNPRRRRKSGHHDCRTGRRTPTWPPATSDRTPAPALGCVLKILRQIMHKMTEQWRGENRGGPSLDRVTQSG